MTHFKVKRLPLLIGLAFAAPALLAQPATDVGRITVQGQAGGTDTGLITQEEAPKARSAVTRQHLEQLNPSSGVFQTIDLLPGVNSFSHDATGLFGGGIRVRGFAGDQMGLTINGAPVNDSGNFAVYPQEYTDTENLCEVFITQGATDTEAPHVGATGGNLGMVTCSPKDKHGVRFAQSVGGLNYSRTFLRVDTGKFGQSNTKAFVSYSKSKVDKFKGEGGADRDHVDLGIEAQPSRDLFLASSFLYNRAVNNNYRTLTTAQIAASGDRLDFGTSAPQHLTPVAGTSQNESAPADGFYKFNTNPFRNFIWTGKAEWRASQDLTISAEPYFWYGFGTGGSQLQTLTESSNASLLGGGVRDINGDGDTLDRVMVYGSSVTRTYRPGMTVKANWQLGNHSLLAGYWYERARHQQTGPRTTFDNNGNPANAWLDDSATFLRRQDGTTFQARDWKTINTAGSLFLQDTISLMNDKAKLQLGLRQTELERDFTNYANEGSTSATGRSDGTYNIVKTYRKLLPSASFKYNLTPAQSVFTSIGQNFRTPSNFVLSNLLQGGSVVNGQLTGATLRQPVVGPETSVNLDLGYRFQGERTTFSGTVFMVDYKNRIASAWDPVNAIRTDYNVGNVKTRGFELESATRLDANFSLYGSLTYTDSEMQQNLQLNATSAEATAGKQFPDTPKWLAGLALSYTQGPLSARLSAKHTGKAFSTLVNDASMQAYTLFNLSAGYKLPSSGFFKSPQIRLNVDNLFDKKYLRINSPSGSSFTTRAQGAGGSLPSYYIGSPRFVSVTLSSDF